VLSTDETQQLLRQSDFLSHLFRCLVVIVTMFDNLPIVVIPYRLYLLVDYLWSDSQTIGIMRINNATELYHFVRNNMLIGMAPELAGLVVCIEEYGRLCHCDSVNVKNAKLNQCKSLYLAFASKAHAYKTEMFSKTGDAVITFTNDGQHITTLNR